MGLWWTVVRGFPSEALPCHEESILSLEQNVHCYETATPTLRCDVTIFWACPTSCGPATARAPPHDAIKREPPGGKRSKNLYVYIHV